MATPPSGDYFAKKAAEQPKGQTTSRSPFVIASIARDLRDNPSWTAETIAPRYGLAPKGAVPYVEDALALIAREDAAG